MSSAATQITLSRHDQIQAVKRHPEFQYYLAQWQDILHREEAGRPITDEQEAMKWEPRSRFNAEAELEATRYRLLSLAECDQSTMSQEELAWRDCVPQLDWVNKTAGVHIPLNWPIESILLTVGRIVRVYKERLGLQRTRAERSEWQEGAAQLDQVNQTATLRIPLNQPVEFIEEVVGGIVHDYKDALGLSSPQRIRRPEHVDPWAVYDLHLNRERSLLAITHGLFGTSGSPAYDEELDKVYSRVKRAYQFAKNAIDFVGREYATSK